MANKQKDITFQIEDANMRFRNFSGNKTQFNPAGNRNFCVDVPSEMVDDLVQDGWTVKFLDPREEGDEPQPYIQVKVKYDFKPPRITMVTSRGQVPLTEDMVGILDFADVQKVDVIIRAFPYNVNGKEGLSAYCKTLYVTIEEDELERKYGTGEVVARED